MCFFEGILKSKLYNSILNFAIFSVFNVRNVIIQCEKCNDLALIRGGGSDQFTASEKFGPLAPQNSETCRPPPPPHTPPPIFKTFLRL